MSFAFSKLFTECMENLANISSVRKIRRNKTGACLYKINH